MKIKLMPLLAGLITLSAVATPFILKVQAQTSDQPAQAQTTHHEHHSEWDKLGLSDAQKAQLEQIEKDTYTQIKAVFTPQQQAQLDAAEQAHQASQAGQAHQERHNAWASLNLTDDQKAKIKAIREAQKSRMQAILTPAQQQQWQQQEQQEQQMHQQWQQQHQQQQNNQ